MDKREYARINREWLAGKAAEPDVIALDKGVCYKVLKKGNGTGSPNRNSVVTCHYVGRTINGRCFDKSTGGPAPAFRLRELIPGWVIAMTQMHPGDKWEVYIPAEQGYGSRSIPGIPGNSTLIFEIELKGFA